MKKVLSAFILLLVNVAGADVLLSEASNAQLLNEVSLRLEGHVTGPLTIASFSCNSSTLHINAVNSNGEEQSATAILRFSSDCNGYKELFNRKLSEVTGLKVFAVCNGNVLSRFALSRNGLSVLEKKTLRFSSDCDKEEQTINSRL